VWRPRRGGRCRAAPEDRRHPTDRAAPRRFVTALTALSNSSVRSGVSAAWVFDKTMLSIGKLAVGKADYYLEQPHGAVTRAGSVHSGVEDYYFGGPEAAGVWMASERLRSASPAQWTPRGSTVCSRASTRRSGNRSGASFAAGCLGLT
jgi:hypothetical protein